MRRPPRLPTPRPPLPRLPLGLLAAGALVLAADTGLRAVARPDLASLDPLAGPLGLLGLGLIAAAGLSLLRARVSGAPAEGRALERDGGPRTILPPAPGAETDRTGARGAAGAVLPRPAVRFADVAGAEEAKVELAETIEFLRNPERFTALGAQVPRGVLFHGPPGNGKTLLARAVAGEAEVPFTYASGSDFVEMYVGVGAARVRRLFAEAKKHGAGVIFIDEIDALARRRSAVAVTGTEERDGTLNALLTEMDGFATDERLVVIGATNRVDTLDPAILRPGRLTRRIHVGMPDREARRAILAVHARGKPLAADVDLEGVARRTAGFSGAQLADLLNEGAIAAARRGSREVSPEDVRTGWLKAAVGVSRERSMPPRERAVIAAHEAGHAVCGWAWGDRRRVEEISLHQHGEALGVTVSSSEDDLLPAERDLRALLVALMGGRAAEALVVGDRTGGASSDFAQARGLAAQMVRRWGLGEDPVTGRAGVALVGHDELPASQELLLARERAEDRLLEDALHAATATLERHRDALDRVAAHLHGHERLDGETFADLAAGRLQPAVGTLAAWHAAVAAARVPPPGGAPHAAWHAAPPPAGPTAPPPA